MIRAILIAALALVGLVGLAFADPIWTFLSPPTVTKRYLVEAQVQVGQDVFIGRTIWEIRLWRQGNAFPKETPAFRREVHGEAIPFDISGEETLFVLKRPSEGGGDISYGEFILECLDWESSDHLVEVLRNFEGGCEVDREPLIVRASGDPSSPTIESLNGEGVASNVKLVGLRVQVTNEPVTVGIARTYPWILALPEPQGSNVTKVIYRHDFTTEL